MTSKEALKILEFGGVGYKPVEKDEAVFIIKKDLEILEKLKKVLSNVSHGSSIMSLSESDENGIGSITIQPKVSLGEEFDTAFFQCILDELGFELVKKETESK